MAWFKVLNISLFRCAIFLLIAEIICMVIISTESLAESHDTTAPVFEGIWSGYVESLNEALLDGESILEVSRQRLWLQADYEHDWVRFYLSGYGEFDVATEYLPDNQIHKDLSLYECYLTLDWSSVDIIVGQKRYFWGMVDSISPLDIINPVDYRYPVGTTLNQNRLPVPSLFAEKSFGAVVLQSLFLPIAEFSELPFSTGAWLPSSLGYLQKLKQSGLARIEDDDNNSRPEAGFCLKTYQHRIDLSFIYFNGITNDPLYQAVQVAEVPVFKEIHKRFQAFGFATAMGLENSTIRAEISYKSHYPFESKDYQIEAHDWLQLAGGVDRTFDNDLYCNFQGYFENIRGNSSTLLDDKETHGLTWEVTKKFLHDDLLLGFSGIYVMSDGSRVYRLRTEYLIGDSWKIAGSLYLFEGDDDSTYGQYDDNDLLQISLRYLF